MKVATWNVNSLRARLDHVRRWTEELGGADVVLLQETKLTDDLFPAEALRDMGYTHLAWYGEPTYNGVAILSRHPIEDVQLGFDDEDDPQKRLISGTVQGVRVYGCYVPNGTEVGSPRFHYKLRWLDRLRALLDRKHDPTEDVLVCGDMNIAPDDPDVWDPFRCEGRLLFHPDERAKLTHLLDWGLADAWREQHPFANDFSWWDYRRMGFQRNQGLRIDHVFLSESLMKRVSDVRIDRDVRGWDTPSDHVPVVATI